MTNSFRRDNPPLLIVSIKILRTFFPARLENADKATSPIAFAYKNGEKKTENQRRCERIKQNKRGRDWDKLRMKKKWVSNIDDKKTD